MYRNQVTSLLDHERIETTDAKAKGVRRLAERMITLGKRGDLHARRRALRVIRSRDVTAKVFDDLAERFRDRPGGYTRIIKVRNRVGDAAPMSIIELVEGAIASKPAAKPAKNEAAKRKKTVAAEEKASKKKKTAAEEKAAKKKTAAEEKADKKKKAADEKVAKKKKATTKKAGAKKTSSKKSEASKKKTAKKKVGAKKTTKKK